MKNLLLVTIALFILSGCGKLCDCTYYSVNTATGSIIHESPWNGCEEEDFGTAQYGLTTVHSYVKCK